MNSLFQKYQQLSQSKFLSKAPLSLVATATAAIAISLAGGLPFLLIATAVVTTALSLFTRQGTDKILNRLPSFFGGSSNLFLFFGLVIGISLLAHGAPSHAIFDGAKSAAKSGIGQYIEEDNALSIIDTITFGMWAFAAIGGIATIAGGVVQNIMVLVGGLVLFFGMAILIGVLEFTDGLLFGTT